MRFVQFFRKSVPGTFSEEEQLAAYRASGDVRLLGPLYQPYMEQMFAVCYKYLRDEAESKDAVMHIFEKLVTDLRSHEVSHFKAWLHTVARNHCLMRLRSLRLTNSADLPEEVPDTAETLTAHLLNENRLDRLHECLGQLTDGQRQAVEMFYMREKCYREISEETGLAFNQVKSYIQNGKRNLKICMEKNGKI